MIGDNVPYATHPPFLPFPHPQSLRRPCLRGRRGSSTIANGSAAEWWRGVMKPITTPINLTPRGILTDRMCVKTAMCMCVQYLRVDTRRGGGPASFNSAFQGACKIAFFFSPGCWSVSSTNQTLTPWPVWFRFIEHLPENSSILINWEML